MNIHCVIRRGLTIVELFSISGKFTNFPQEVLFSMCLATPILLDWYSFAYAACHLRDDDIKRSLRAIGEAIAGFSSIISFSTVLYQRNKLQIIIGVTDVPFDHCKCRQIYLKTLYIIHFKNLILDIFILIQTSDCVFVQLN